MFCSSECVILQAPRFHSDFRPADPRRTYNQTRNASTFANPISHVFHNTNYRPSASTNCRPNGIVSNDKVLLSEKFRSGESEVPKEMTRGPRFHQNNSNPESSVVKDEFAFTVCRYRYNLPDFQTKYETAKFYMIKSFNEDDIQKGIKYDVWTSTPHGNKKLNAAFQSAEAKSSETDTQCPIFLFFSVSSNLFPIFSPTILFACHFFKTR